MQCDHHFQRAQRAHPLTVQRTLDCVHERDPPAPGTQTEVVAKQCATWADDRWFDLLGAEAAQRSDVSPSTVDRLAAGVEMATNAFGAFAGYLRDDYLQDATPVDACGPERYTVCSRAMNGAELDPTEMYEWAWTEYHTLRREILQTCELIKPGATFEEVRELLDTDPKRSVHGVDAYRDWLQSMTDDALRRAGEQFDIPEVMNRCEVHIPPAGSAAAPYYTGPSEDFSRPGRTWYPALGRTSFPMWGDVTTCYHESVPGHHLQIGYARLQGQHLSRFQAHSRQHHAQRWLRIPRWPGVDARPGVAVRDQRDRSGRDVPTQ